MLMRRVTHLHTHFVNLHAVPSDHIVHCHVAHVVYRVYVSHSVHAVHSSHRHRINVVHSTHAVDGIHRMVARAHGAHTVVVTHTDRAHSRHRASLRVAPRIVRLVRHSMLTLHL